MIKKHPIERKYPNAKYERGRQYIFPATRISTEPRLGIQRRHHLYDTIIQKAAKQASRHTFRHSNPSSGIKL